MQEFAAANGAAADLPGNGLILAASCWGRGVSANDCWQRQEFQREGFFLGGVSGIRFEAVGVLFLNIVSRCGDFFVCGAMWAVLSVALVWG